VSDPRHGPPALSDVDLLALLRTVSAAGAGGGSLDSLAVGRSLGWSDACTADALGTAKERMLIWGIRIGGQPAPRFDEIELTVQGERMVAAADG
jgi:hypothetical protein